MKVQAKFYVLFCVCLLLSCVVLYNLPQSFSVHFDLHVSQLNITQISPERFDALKTKRLPKSVQCLPQSATDLYRCSFQTEKRSLQKRLYRHVQNNMEHGYLSPSLFLNEIEEKLKRLKQYRQDNVNLELKMVALDDKLDETDLQTALSWQDTLYHLNTEIAFNQDRLRFFNQVMSESEQDSQNYQDKITQLEETLAQLKQELSLHEKEKISFSEVQNQYIDITQQLKSNTDKINELRQRSSFLENIYNDYAAQSKIPHPDQIQWKISRLTQATQHDPLAKIIYVIPFAFLMFAVVLALYQLWIKQTNQHELDTLAISKILNVPYLGDLNSFFPAKHGTETS